MNFARKPFLLVFVLFFYFVFMFSLLFVMLVMFILVIHLFSKDWNPSLS